MQDLFHQQYPPKDIEMIHLPWLPHSSKSSRWNIWLPACRDIWRSCDPWHVCQISWSKGKRNGLSWVKKITRCIDLFLVWSCKDTPHWWYYAPQKPIVGYLMVDVPETIEAAVCCYSLPQTSWIDCLLAFAAPNMVATSSLIEKQHPEFFHVFPCCVMSGCHILVWQLDQASPTFFEGLTM